MKPDITNTIVEMPGRHKGILSVPSRILVAFASGALLSVFFLPAWQIYLYAPQYPEGLVMNIWINNLTGDIDVINGLNHYIGMKTLHTKDFIEFLIEFLKVFCRYLAILYGVTFFFVALLDLHLGTF